MRKNVGGSNPNIASICIDMYLYTYVRVNDHREHVIL